MDAGTIAAFIPGLFRVHLAFGDSSSIGDSKCQVLSLVSTYLGGALRAWAAQVGLPAVRMAIQVRRRVAFLTRKWRLLPRYASKVFTRVQLRSWIAATELFQALYVLTYPVGWATRRTWVPHARTRAAVLEFVNAQGPTGATLLIKASRLGRVDVVEELLQLIPQHVPASTLEACDTFGLTALHYAAYYAHEEVINLLLRSGAQASSQANRGHTPLMLGVIHQQAPMVRRLLKQVAASDLERRNDQGETAVHLAATLGDEEVVDLLLTRGALAHVKDGKGVTPLMNASSQGHLGLVKKLPEVEGGPGLEEKDEKGHTALQHAASGGHEAVVAFLLSNGAQASSKDNEGAMPLMDASLRGHQGVVRMLLQHTRGQRLNDRMEDGRTALRLACWEDCAQGIVKVDDVAAEEIVRMLLLAGADTTIMNNQGATPRAVAEARGHSELVAIFDWWEGELERPYLLHRAKCLREAQICMTHQDDAAAPLPAYLKTRGATGLALPRVEVVARQQSWYPLAGTASREAAEEDQHVVLTYVLEMLNEQLFLELMAGFRSATG